MMREYYRHGKQDTKPSKDEKACEDEKQEADTEAMLGKDILDSEPGHVAYSEMARAYGTENIQKLVPTKAHKEPDIVNVTFNEWMNCEYEQQTLYIYLGSVNYNTDYVVVNDDDEVIDNYETLIGKSIIKDLDFGENAFIINNDKCIAYEIVKINEEFEGPGGGY